MNERKYAQTIGLHYHQLFYINSWGAISMRSLDQLVNKTDPGWPVVRQWIDSAKNKVEVLPVDTIKAKMPFTKLK